MDSAAAPTSISYASADLSSGVDDLQDAYLSELLSYSLERLNKEPELLRAEADRVRRQMQEVAVGHYQAFITAAGSVQSIKQEISTINTHLDKLVQPVPQLTQGCSEFMEEAQQIVEKRRLNRTMLGNHGALLETLKDLLEIPQLIDSCVRNGNYDEALDLEAFVSKLATVHFRLPIIQSLAADVRQTTQVMLSQLLQRLCSNIQLPECLRVIGYLRRLAVFSEHEMRLQFLQCRESWLADIIDEFDQSNPYDYLKKMTDCHRVHLFDVVTQYRAIFADDTSAQEEANDGGLVYSWAMHRVACYVSVLQAVLPKIPDGGSLASVLEHCMYCGMSLGRVGLDFRNLLPSLFESCVLDLFRRNISLALQSFQHVLDTHHWVPMLSMGTSTRSNTNEENSDDVTPPYSLMEHPPLATFVNGALAALNELRHCAPTSLRHVIAKELQQALQRVAEALLRYHGMHARMLRDTESSLFLSLCRAFVEVACPYCVLCFSRCYAGSATLVDTKAVLEPIRKLLFASLPPPVEKRPVQNANGSTKSAGRAEGEATAAAATRQETAATAADGSERSTDDNAQSEASDGKAASSPEGNGQKDGEAALEQGEGLPENRNAGVGKPPRRGKKLVGSRGKADGLGDVGAAQVAT